MPSYDKADLQRRMHGAVEALKHDLGGLRTGRASTALLDPVTVEVYGANMPLHQVATVSAPETRTLAVAARVVWRNHAAEPGSDRPRARAAHDVGAGLGSRQRPAGRKGDPFGGT